LLRIRPRINLYFRAPQLPARVRIYGARAFGAKSAKSPKPTKYAPVIYDFNNWQKGPNTCPEGTCSR